MKKRKQSNPRDTWQNNFTDKNKNDNNSDDDKSNESKKNDTNTSQQSQRDSVQFSTTSEEIAPANTASASNDKSQKSGSNFLMQGYAGLGLKNYNADGNFCFVSSGSVQFNNDNLTNSSSSSAQPTPSAPVKFF